MKKITILLLFFIALTVGKIALAAGTIFFEFAPYVSSPLKISSWETPSQIFIPANDFFRGFDIWIDNIGDAGTTSFNLYDNQGNLIATKTASIPTIVAKYGGQRFHVDFEGQLAISNTPDYKLEFVSATPELRLYYGDKIQLLSQNASFPPENLLKSAYLGTTAQSFNFKLALYESRENAPPIISNVTSTAISPQKTRIEFNANEPVDSKLIFGIAGESYDQTVDFTGNYEFCPEGIATCSLIADVLPETDYNYQLLCEDYWENQTQFEGEFTSPEEILPPPPNPPVPPLPPVPPEPPAPPAPTSTIPEEHVSSTLPVISNIRVVLVTSSSVAIAWTTNETANSNLSISSNSGGSQVITTAIDPVFELEHLLATPNILKSKTKYFALISSADQSGNTTSSLINFTTLSQSQNEPPPTYAPILPVGTSTEPGGANPPLINVEIPDTNNQGGQNVIISWIAPEGGEPASGYRIDLFDQNNQLKKQIFVESGKHKIVLTNLSPGKYYLIIYADYNGVYQKISQTIVDFVVPNPIPLPSFFEKLKFYRPFILYSFLTLFIIVIVFIFLKKYGIKKNKSNEGSSGFTLIEITIGSTILIFIFLVSSIFFQFISKVGILPTAGLEPQQEIQDVFRIITPELRAMEVSNNGTYPIETASTSSLTFYSDIDKDGLVERVRYFTSGTTFRKGLVKPSGNPLTYNLSSEIISTAANQIVATSSDAFSYYSGNYTGSETKMIYPIDIHQIRTIKIELTANQNSGTMQIPSTFSIQVTPRNLRYTQ